MIYLNRMIEKYVSMDCVQIGKEYDFFFFFFFFFFFLTHGGRFLHTA